MFEECAGQRSHAWINRVVDGTSPSSFEASWLHCTVHEESTRLEASQVPKASTGPLRNHGRARAARKSPCTTYRDLHTVRLRKWSPKHSWHERDTVCESQVVRLVLDRGDEQSEAGTSSAKSAPSRSRVVLDRTERRQSTKASRYPRDKHPEVGKNACPA